MPTRGAVPRRTSTVLSVSRAWGQISSVGSGSDRDTTQCFLKSSRVFWTRQKLLKGLFDLTGQVLAPCKINATNYKSRVWNTY